MDIDTLLSTISSGTNVTTNILDVNPISKDYSIICRFIMNKIKRSLPRSVVDIFETERGINNLVISYLDMTLSLNLEFGYAEFKGTKYTYNLIDIIRLVEAIIKTFQSLDETTPYSDIYIQSPSPVVSSF